MNVIMGVTGSIAAYKAAELLRLMKRAGWYVDIVMTSAATRFVTPLTFQTLSGNPVTVDMFEMPEDWVPDHVSLADKADVMVVAPCTANVIAKIALGIADDILSCTALARDKPLVIAPAMNERMWLNPATKANVATLESRGVVVMEVESGDLACGWDGKGRMPSPENIMAVVRTAAGA